MDGNRNSIGTATAAARLTQTIRLAGNAAASQTAAEGQHRTQTAATLAVQSATQTALAELPKGMVLIPAGEFEMGSAIGEDDEKPVHTVYLDGFYIDVYEVANTQFAEFLNKKANLAEGGKAWFAAGVSWVHIGKSGGRWQAESGYADHPVVGVTWYGAAAYCAWAGKRLPTEAEWEKAARGGLKGKQFPWGDAAPICTKKAGNGAQFEPCGRETAPVGSFAPNGYGLFDVAGNVWEWVSDWYGSYDQMPQSNPNGPVTGSLKVMRGAGWYFYADNLRTANRSQSYPTEWNGSLGFRCAATAAP
jgi:formylglycine-generating enzyme required for sulfatase activity